MVPDYTAPLAIEELVWLIMFTILIAQYLIVRIAFNDWWERRQARRRAMTATTHDRR